MPVTRFACPACHLVLQSGNPLEEGRKVKCQECGIIFPVKQLDEAQIPQPVVATAVVVPTRPASRPPRRARGYDGERREYEKQQQSRTVMIAVGSLVALLVVAGLVVGIIALSGGKDSDKRVAKNDNRPSGGASSAGRGFDVSSPPPSNAGPASTGAGKNQEEDEPPAEKPRKDPPPSDPPAGGGPSLASAGDAARPQMPKPGEGYPKGLNGSSDARGPSLPSAPGSNQKPQYPGYPPGYKPPEGKENDKPDENSPIPPNYPGAPKGGSSGSGVPPGTGGPVGSVGGGAPGGSKSPPNYPRTPSMPGTPGPGGGVRPPGVPGGNNDRQGFPPNTPPPKEEEKDPNEGKLADLPADWPKYKGEYPNQGLEVSFTNTLNAMVVIGIRSEKTTKGYAWGSDLNVGPGETIAAYLKNGYYEVFMVPMSDTSKTRDLGRLEVQNNMSAKVAKEGAKYVLKK